MIFMCLIEMIFVFKLMFDDELYIFFMKFICFNIKYFMLVKYCVKEYIVINIFCLCVLYFYWIFCIIFVVCFRVSWFYNVNKNKIKGLWDKENYLNYKYGIDIDNVF